MVEGEILDANLQEITCVPGGLTLLAPLAVSGTGRNGARDGVDLLGSGEQHRENFIHPDREWLARGENPSVMALERMVFNKPFLPVQGNHGHCAPLSWLGLLSGLSTLFGPLLRRVVDLTWHGSFQVDASGHEAVIRCQAKGRFEVIQPGKIRGL